MTGIVAITGPIGSGKTSASQIFESFGVPVIDADMIARELVLPSEVAFEKIIKRWGLELVRENGDLNRAKLREIIFNNAEDKKWLEELLHPAIYEKILSRIKEIKAPYCLLVLPLLAEDYERYQSLIDYVILMDTPEEHRYGRVSLRDNHKTELIKKMIEHHKEGAALRLQMADTVLKNDGTLLDLQNKVKNLHHHFLELYK